jgi:BirA family transcriptional regulator, biotin operon repressor / biotin---[acetyl-CoA-carboxylase] ligase
MDCSRLAELQARFPFELQVLDEVDSTNRVARDLADEGCAHGTTVLTLCQTGGRGRLGRTWQSPTGANLMLSTVLRPALGPQSVALVCLGAAVAVCDAVGLPLQVKWPNDILEQGGAKVGGILAEAEFSRGKVVYLVVGIGLNCESAPHGVPNAACLADQGFMHTETLELGFRVVQELIAATAMVESNPEGLLERWRTYSCTLGARVRVGAIEGLARDIDRDGALLIETDDGILSRVLAGDVEMVSTTNSRP